MTHFGKWGTVYMAFLGNGVLSIGHFRKWGTVYMEFLKSLWTLSRSAKNCAFKEILGSCLSQRMLGGSEKQAHSYSHSGSVLPSEE